MKSKNSKIFEEKIAKIAKIAHLFAYLLVLLHFAVLYRSVIYALKMFKKSIFYKLYGEFYKV